MLNLNSKYPSRRAYVLKLHSDARSDALCGRLENLLTCAPADFLSSRELLDLIARDLESCGAEQPSDI